MGLEMGVSLGRLVMLARDWDIGRNEEFASISALIRSPPGVLVGANPANISERQ